MDSYFLIINPMGRNDLSKPYACFHYGIKWIPEKIANYEKANGYIVQKITIEAPSYLRGFPIKKYYEAWKVEDGSVIYAQLNDNDEDDVFSYSINAITESMYKKGAIKYLPIVYWVDYNSEKYNEVDNWEYGTVIQAGDMIKSSESFDETNLHPAVNRSEFVFKFDFTDDKLIKEVLLTFGRNMYSCERICERKNFRLNFEDVFKESNKEILFEEIIATLEKEYENDIIEQN